MENELSLLLKFLQANINEIPKYPKNDRDDILSIVKLLNTKLDTGFRNYNACKSIYIGGIKFRPIKSIQEEYGISDSSEEDEEMTYNKEEKEMNKNLVIKQIELKNNHNLNLPQLSDHEFVTIKPLNVNSESDILTPGDSPKSLGKTYDPKSYFKIGDSPKTIKRKLEKEIGSSVGYYKEKLSKNQRNKRNRRLRDFISHLNLHY
jgi:hypothetical protein